MDEIKTWLRVTGVILLVALAGVLIFESLTAHDFLYWLPALSAGAPS